MTKVRIVFHDALTRHFKTAPCVAEYNSQATPELAELKGSALFDWALKKYTDVIYNADNSTEIISIVVDVDEEVSK